MTSKMTEKKVISGDDIQKRIAQLETIVEQSGGAKTKCFPTAVYVGGTIPFVVLIVLFFWQPAFIQKKEGDRLVKDGKKFFFWSIGITIILWVLLYIYSAYSKNKSMTCVTNI